MYFSDRVELCEDQHTPNKNGYPEHDYPGREVWADVQSVKRDEFYKSMAAGLTLTLTIVVHAEDYNSEPVVKFEGRLYSVQRAYRKGLGEIELICKDIDQNKQVERNVLDGEV